MPHFSIISNQKSREIIRHIHRFLQSVKGIWTKILVDFSKTFDSKHIEKKEQILLACSLKEILTCIMNGALQKEKAKVCLFDGDINFFDIVAGFLQEDILAPYLFIHCLD